MINPIQQYILEGFRITSPYGPRPTADNPDKFHHGTDLGGKPRYTPVKFWYNGTVRWRGYNSSYGNHVIIKSAAGKIHLLAHLTDYSVTPGQVLKYGDVIGRLGTTGISTGVHLHYEIRNDDGSYNGGAVWGDPEKYYEEVDDVETVNVYDYDVPTAKFEAYGFKAADGTTKTFVELRALILYLKGNLKDVSYPTKVPFVKPPVVVCDTAVEDKAEEIIALEAALRTAYAELKELVK